MGVGNDQIAAQAADALLAGDMDRLGSVFTEDIKLHVPGSNQISGDYTSRQEFFESFLSTVMKLTGGDFVLEPHDFTASADHPAGIYTIRAGREGRKLEWPHVNVYHFRDGKISEIWQHPGNFEAWNEFWS